jgi:hypothetical protein
MALLRYGRHTLEINVKGGLGNQLFQFSNGLEHAVNLKRSIRFLDESFKFDKKRDFLLNQFGILQNVEYRVHNNPKSGLTFEAIDSINCCSEMTPVYETVYNYVQPAPDLSESKCIKLDGYWQSEKNFATLKDPIVQFLNVSIKEQKPFARGNTLMHIRQGDFTSERRTQVEHGILGPNYYMNALELLKNSSEIDIVSDQPSKVNSYLGRKFCKNYNIRVLEPMSELQSLAAFREYDNLVLANSTFSWWGAFLSNAKLVVAPRAFFSEEGLRKRNICDLYPSNWVLV